jgi:subtilisin family serine protease
VESAIPNQFIIHWRDGTYSVEKASNRELLKETLLAAAFDQIAFVESDYRVHAQGSPSPESLLSTHKSPDNWGQSRIHAEKAWERARGEGLLVAVVDAGVDTMHPQLRNQLAFNSREIPDNATDDDHNGYIDDYFGFDFERGRGSAHDPPNSTHHGSHVAGVIAAEHLADGSGIKGVAPGAKILALSFMNEKGNGSVSDAINAIKYAIARGARIINASWGGAEVCSRALRQTIQDLEAQGVLFVTASGNGNDFDVGVNLDYHPTFPAAYSIPGLLSIGAMDDSNTLTGFSNYSARLVHLLAPGREIWSTVYVDDKSEFPGYKKMDGTSMAAPFVSGAAAVLWSFRPKATVQQIKQALLDSVVVPNPRFPVVTGGYLNLDLALDKLSAEVLP